MSREHEQLARSLESSEELIQAIIDISGDSEWTDECQSIWNDPSKENLLDIANNLKSGIYLWGLSTLTIPEFGSDSFILES